MALEENGFLEYLQLQGGEPDLVTKSELLSQIRKSGYSLSDRQLTFYMTEGLIPRSVRVGTRAGAYPKIVVGLAQWIVAARDAGVSLDALKELLPVWKYLMRVHKEGVLNVAELEIVARQHVTSVEGSIGVPRVVSWVMGECCPDCRTKVEIVYKNGDRKVLSDPEATIGFAIARTPVEEDVDEGDSAPRWYASTRLSLGHRRDFSTDPTTVILGLPLNAKLPEDEPSGDKAHGAADSGVTA
ncbi:hypothetical protein IU436_29335 [Nocardia farcinica]|uniref:hypothetical protein n=1 Tax=Nocardia farcinica TaxID=37329 RepID=UPI001894070A|nr:hypothetical protein [Nocardia farcinica]MBF6422723.1 hypothetical protein [Nocardia farcinica]MBF6434427.1 hypothetical protein [Nocardia farcinica]MBF6505512.1 hypothetical protein [Nocardia farcinica]